MKLDPKHLKFSAFGLIMLALAEGFRGGAYLDTVGVPTIGFGETKNVKLGQTITPERALVRLLESADKEHGEKIKRCMKPEVRMYQKEYDWHLSFAYNIGVHGYCTSNTLRLLNQGKNEEACRAMAGWMKPPEIRGRREREIAGCLAAIEEGKRNEL